VLVPGILVRDDSLLFRIEGDELAAEGLRDGDVILAREADGEIEGKIVIATLEEKKVIIRRYHKRGSMVHFSAIEGERPRIRLPEENVAVKYVVTSITRPFE
jgi:SOS-response transcriptional repressor LexA